MDYSNSFFKPDKIDLVFLVFLLFIMLCNVTFCVEVEDVSISVANNISMALDRNYFVSTTNPLSVGYVKLEKGYIYHFTGISSRRVYAFSNSSPAVNVPYYDTSTIGAGETFSYFVTNDFEYLFFAYNSLTSDVSDVVSVTREYLPSMQGTVTRLSNDVGSTQFWDIFSLAIPFILIVVIVVFGFFIIRRLTKKESKGDIRF